MARCARRMAGRRAGGQAGRRAGGQQFGVRGGALVCLADARFLQQLRHSVADKNDIEHSTEIV